MAYRSESLLDSTDYQGASVTLEKLLPSGFVTRMIRVMVDRPNEILALFRIQTATIEHQLLQLEAAGVPVPQFDPEELLYSEATQRSLSITLNGALQRMCIEHLTPRRVPEEVKAVGFLSLISLRLAEMISAESMNAEAKSDE
ncbi:MAG: hypothetical protein MUE84_11035 [Hyphomonas sp.]|jgi:hypothetical protein|nr:hypothetical protein [Hyphomonas sp.]